jgi:hypothetical protein
VVIQMTNRLLGTVIALALTSGIVAHAAQAPQRPLAPVTLPATLQTVASHVSETATGSFRAPRSGPPTSATVSPSSTSASKRRR